jgi:Phage integrase family
VLSRSFTRLVKRLDLKNLTVHDLRHDAASRLTVGGASQRAVMEILGHRDPRMTVRYQHLAPGHLTEAMWALETPTNAVNGHAGGGVSGGGDGPIGAPWAPDEKRRREVLCNPAPGMVDDAGLEPATSGM